MQRLTLVGVFMLLVAACGSSGNNGNGGNGGSGDGGSVDLSGVVGGSTDLAMSLPADMQPAYGCHALRSCLIACNGDTTCFNNCVASSTMMAQQLYLTALRCQRKVCNPHPDGGPAPCVQGGGAQPPECTTCRADVFKMTGSCGADTMYCGFCYSQYAACEANTP